MSTQTKVVRSVLYWVAPPEDGQALEELDWVWTDIYDDGHMVIRDQTPTAEEISEVVKELKPYFDWGQNAG